MVTVIFNKISFVLSLIPYFVILYLLTVVGNYFTSDNDTPYQNHWFLNVFTEEMRGLGTFISDDMDSTHKIGFRMLNYCHEAYSLLVLNNTPTDTHDLTKNPTHCIDPESVIGMIG